MSMDMERVCIAVTDAARARIYLFERLAAPSGVHQQQLRERIDLVNPARRLRPSELLSETRPGLDRAPNKRGYATDDRRDHYLDELDRRFADLVADELARLVRETGSHEVIVTAPPHMLGALRTTDAISALTRRGVRLHEVDRDLSRLPSAEVQDRLAAMGLLPGREHLPPAAP